MTSGGMPAVPVSQAMIDAAGRVITADPALEALNQRAGGTIGAPLAIPALATIALLARRLGIIVSRSVTIADLDADLDLWVRAQPEGSGVRLAISGWRELRASPSSRGAEPAIEQGDGELRWETDAALLLTFLSIDAARKLGIDALAMLGKPFTALVSLEEHEDGALPIIDAIARRHPLDEQRARLRGSDRPVILAAGVRRDSAGEFAGFVGTARMEEPAILLTAAASISPAFTQGLDKALRAPLARIVAHADTINAAAEGPVQQDYVDYASDIANAGRHLLGLVDDLVDLQAVERPDFTLATEQIDLADVARRAAGLLAVKAANAGVAIAKPLPGVQVPASGDFRRTLQILVNLIGNAVRYSPDGGVVAVTVVHHGATAEVIVADQGKGIAIDDQARIFEKFERVDPSEAGGNGLGLYIARRLAQAMAGDLSVESMPGEGAQFTLTLPVSR